MPWTEIRYHVHLHTRFSDGHGTYQEVLHAAAVAGLHAVNVTDHNILPLDLEGYYTHNGHRVLVLVGEEIHDRLGVAKGHLLALGVRRDVASDIGACPAQTLIDKTLEAGGLAFIAHPIDERIPYLREWSYPWEDWSVTGYHGIELWNAMSEFKRRVARFPLSFPWYVFLFHRVARGPFPETLALWDGLLAQGHRVVAIGGSDAHAFRVNLGPFTLRIYPYVKHFRAVNTHLLLPRPLSGDVKADKALILDALRAGHAFVGYDLPKATDGFRFWAVSEHREAVMGDTLEMGREAVLHIHLPGRAQVRLIRNGHLYRRWHWIRGVHLRVTEPGVYRVEARRFAWGRWRGWIYSNPIYLVRG